MAPALARTDNWPSRPLKLVVGFPPGGSADAIARAIAAVLPASLGQNAVVENRAGASSIIASEYVINANDGHTVLLHPAGIHAIRPHVTTLRFDPWKELLPLTTLAAVPTVFLSSGKRPFKTLADLLAYARANPGKLNMAMAGNATLTHLTSELLRTRAGIDAVAVPFNGAGPALNALLGDSVDVVALDASTVIAQVASGQLRALAVADPQRYPFLPDVPTTAELGYPQVIGSNAYGIHVPAAMPAAHQARLLAAVHAALKVPTLVEAFGAIGLVPQGSTPAAYAALARADETRFKPLIAQLGLRM